jgi:hypothetical protein
LNADRGKAITGNAPFAFLEDTMALGGKEIAHGIHYGTTDERTDTFMPDRDSAATTICQPCGEKLLTLIYVKLNRTNYHQPTRPFQSR